MNSVKEKAYAKINLFIDVLGKRDDGFHDIATVMHTVSLADDITVSVADGFRGGRSVKISLDGNRRLPVDSKNLAVSAANLFLERAGINADVFIKLNKRIPISSGLAGGSADAAATLRAMNKLFRRPLTDKMLLSLASELGSDVPFCLLGGTAFCEGRGEMITRLPSALSLHTVVAVAGEHVSTPRAYAALDEIYSDFKSPRGSDSSTKLEAVINSAKTGAIDTSSLYNIFEEAVLPMCERATLIKTNMLSLGAKASLMSGSGPSVYGIFEDEKTAVSAEQALRNDGILAFYARSI